MIVAHIAVSKRLAKTLKFVRISSFCAFIMGPLILYLEIYIFYTIKILYIMKTETLKQWTAQNLRRFGVKKARSRCLKDLQEIVNAQKVNVWFALWSGGVIEICFL